MKILFFILGLLGVSLAGYMIYVSYSAYVNPKQIYGTWVELNVLETRQDVLVFNKQGVYLNAHLITTNLDYDGKKIKFSTGGGETIYRIAGTHKMPILKRIKPSSPQKMLIRKEDEAQFKQEQSRQKGKSPLSYDDANERSLFSK
ncbi:DUF2850 domain-containing protein [Vibrio salinus]|uniref:DUF2850 domain-containing protein n=1 Tax=Vibrio salinus TaxID=2899784 RepID=UPI001E4BE488|nr:DUF2850 domain-containing protein [Vibrio salinus]MCE0494939.1 DUF2850 domain-containing protein [Vibrio salinus]